MSIFNLKEFKLKTHLKDASIIYKAIDLNVKYKTVVNSFDHEFGTENKDDDIEVHSVFCNTTDISEMLNDDQINDITNLIRGE